MSASMCDQIGCTITAGGTRSIGQLVRQDSPAPAIETAEIFVPALILQIGQSAANAKR